MIEYFVNGGPFMWPILITLLAGVAISAERLYSLLMSSIDEQKFFKEISEKITGKNLEEAVQLCDDTQGPVAKVFHAGLTRRHHGISAVEKAIQNTGPMEMAFLEKNMIWLNAVVTIAPMIGFTGTVVGMISAFDAIKAANDISPAVVAGGISQALLTTAFGLIVAMIIQVFQNFFVSRIDKLVLDMEEQSVRLIDHLYDLDAPKGGKKKL